MIDSIILLPKISAGESIDRHGEKIARGKAKSRLQFLSADNNKIYITAKLINENNILTKCATKFRKKFTHVQLVNGERVYLINKRSLSKRLHLNSEDIAKAVKENNLLSQMTKRALFIPEIVSSYTLINKKWTSLSSDFHGKPLMDLIHYASEKYRDNHFKPCKIRYRGEKFIVNFHDGHYVILRFLGEKIKGVIEKIQEINTEKKYALKQVEKSLEKNQVVQKSRLLTNEYRVLLYLNQKGPVWGLQTKPLLHFYDTKNFFFYVGELYQTNQHCSNYLQYCTNKPGPDLKDFCYEADQILSGVAHIHTYNAVHGDIKASNILVKTDEEGDDLFHLADVEGIVPNVPKFSRITRTITLAKDYKHLFHVKDEKIAFRLARQIDVFQTGLLLFKRLAKFTPYQKNDCKEQGLDRFLSTKRLYTYSQEPKQNYYPACIPLGLQKLIEEMIDPDWTKRPTIFEARLRLHELMKGSAELQPIYVKIQSKIGTYYPGTEKFPENQ